MARKEPDFAERLQTAANAKQAQLKKMRETAPAIDAPSGEQEAARLKALEARKARTAERKNADRLAAEKKIAARMAEKATQAQAIADEAARKEAERVAQAKAAAALKLDQKAARDSKYAARKARQR